MAGCWSGPGRWQSLQQVPDPEKLITDKKRVYGLGILLEDKAIKFYEECRKKVTAAGAKKGLKVIIMEEQKHKALFEKLLTEGENR